MPVGPQCVSEKLWRAIVWTLRITVALECLGNWRWFAQIGETPLLVWLISPADIGGLALSESIGLAVQQSIGWLALAAGVGVVLRPCAAVLGPLTVLQLLIAVAMWRTDYGFRPQATWLPSQLTALFPFATQAARIVAPLALLLVDPWRVARPLKQRHIETAMNLLTCGTALTFFSHGIEAWQHYPAFIDLLLNTDIRFLGIGLTQSGAEQLLSYIGAMDMLTAAVCLNRRWRGILWWMAFWGGITALSRISAFGFDSAWHAAAIRAPHLGAPLAVVLYWHLLRLRSAGDQAVSSSNEPAD